MSSIISRVAKRCNNGPLATGQIGIKFVTRHVIYHNLAIFTWKKHIYVTGFETSSLICKCIFYKPEHNTNGDPLKLCFEGLKCRNEIY